MSGTARQMIVPTWNEFWIENDLDFSEMLKWKNIIPWPTSMICVGKDHIINPTSWQNMAKPQHNYKVLQHFPCHWEDNLREQPHETSGSPIKRGRDQLPPLASTKPSRLAMSPFGGISARIWIAQQNRRPVPVGQFF